MFFLMTEQLEGREGTRSCSASHSVGKVDGPLKNRWWGEGHCGWRCDQVIDIEDHGPAIGSSGETCHFSILVCALDQSWLRVHCPRTTSFDGGES